MNWNDSHLSGPIAMGDLIRQSADTCCIYDLLPSVDVQAAQQRVGSSARRIGAEVSVALILAFERSEPRRMLRVTVIKPGTPKKKTGRAKP